MFCSNCGAQATGAFCSKCGSSNAQGSQASFINHEKTNFRKNFALTFVLALGTAIFWVLQSYVPNSLVVSAFGPLSSLLSLVARGSVIISFIARSPNWLAVSAISSTSSLLLGVIGASVYGGYTPESWAVTMTWLFSLATLIAYFLQARKIGVRPYVVERRQ